MGDDESVHRIEAPLILTIRGKYECPTQGPLQDPAAVGAFRDGGNGARRRYRYAQRRKGGIVRARLPCVFVQCRVQLDLCSTGL